MAFALTGPRARTRLPTLTQVGQALFVLTVCAAAAMPWLAPRLPMVDLPQHAAQVALWRDLLLGTSPWSDLVGTNLLTPYLVAYGLMLPLSLVLPLTVAAKLILTAALLGFVAACVRLRKALDGDPRLDWLCPIGFFGYAWQWGFLTFLAAAPLGLFFLVVALRHARAPTGRNGARLLALGLLCLFAHGLIFLMAGALGGLLACRALWQRRFAVLLPTLLPYLAMAAALVLLRVATRDDTAAFHYDGAVYGFPVWLRPSAIIGYLTDIDGSGPPLPRPAVVLMLLVPAVLGLGRNRRGGTWLLAGVLALLIGLPFYAVQTAGLFNRFALFFMPAFALAFRKADAPQPAREAAALAILVTTCWFTLGTTARQIVAFGTESRSFETVLDAAQPGRRALALMFDRDSAAAANPQAYMHFAAWYGAEKQGFVDFNFAIYPPQVVRFRPDRRPATTSRIGWHPDQFDWAAPEARIYDYVFVRGDAGAVAGIRAASPCPLDTVAADALWTLLARSPCGGSPYPR